MRIMAARWLIGARTQVLSIRMVRYVFASVAALGCDLAVFFAMLLAGTDPVVAAVIGYSSGILLHWLLSSRMVFAIGVATNGTERIRQKVLFVASALAGLTLTMGIVAVGAELGVAPQIAKAVAIVVSFAATYVLRAGIVFHRKAA